jgi:hypothetical protein
MMTKDDKEPVCEELQAAERRAAARLGGARNRAQAMLLEIASFALDALIEQGVEVTPGQYRRAIEEAGRQMESPAGGKSPDAPDAYRHALDAAIAAFLMEQSEHGRYETTT